MLDLDHLERRHQLAIEASSQTFDYLAGVTQALVKAPAGLDHRRLALGEYTRFVEVEGDLEELDAYFEPLKVEAAVFFGHNRDIEPSLGYDDIVLPPALKKMAGIYMGSLTLAPLYDAGREANYEFWQLVDADAEPVDEVALAAEREIAIVKTRQIWESTDNVRAQGRPELADRVTAVKLRQLLELVETKGSQAPPPAI